MMWTEGSCHYYCNIGQILMHFGINKWKCLNHLGGKFLTWFLINQFGFMLVLFSSWITIKIYACCRHWAFLFLIKGASPSWSLVSGAFFYVPATVHYSMSFYWCNWFKLKSNSTIFGILSSVLQEGEGEQRGKKLHIIWPQTPQKYLWVKFVKAS